MKGGMGNLMQQAQKMQEDLQKAQEELAQMEVTGESGGGMVQVVMTGKHEVRRVTIDDSVELDDTVDWLLGLAALHGDRFQRTARRQHWQQAIIEMAYRKGVWP